MDNRYIHILFIACASLCISCVEASAQDDKVYFVDGFHGGVYGHYPVGTYTDYMTGLLDRYPQWRMCLEIEPETWDTVQVRTPEAYMKFKEWSSSDRVEFTNPAYAQPYMYNISGESIIRQFYYGMRKINSHFPEVEFSTYAVEEPCFTSALPQILRQFGFRYASLKCPNTCWGGYAAPYGGELVNWIGPDGTSVLASPRYGCEELQSGSVWQTTAWGNSDEYIQACRKAGIRNIVGMCYQDAGWTFGPWIGYADSVRNNSVYVTWKEYFEEKADETVAEDYMFSQEDVRPGLMWGSQVLQTIARQVRRTENRIVTTEKLGAMAALDNGYRYSQEEMDEAWRTLMLAQHHDSWIVPYNRLNSRGTWADNIALWTAASDSICNTIDSASIASFSRGRSSGKSVVRVFNTLGYGRNEAVLAELPEACAVLSVKDYRGAEVPSSSYVENGKTYVRFIADVPAFGYASFVIEKKASGQEPEDRQCRVFTEGDVTVENGMYRIVFDASRGGVIKSLISKADGNMEFADRASRYSINELRGFFYAQDAFRSSAETHAEITVSGDSMEKTVTVRGSIADVPFEQTVVLTEGEKRIDCRLRIDWRSNTGIGQYAQNDGFNANRRAFYDDRYKLSLLFPVDVPGPEIYKDAPFDVCRSTLEDTFFETWDNIKHNVILHWVDMSGKDGKGSFALLTDHTGAYSYGKNFPLGLTVQYSGNGLWGRDYPLSGPTEMKYAIVPHTGDWKDSGIYGESLEWNEPMICSVSSKPVKAPVSFIDAEGTGYEISAAYMTDAGLVVRIFNASGDDSVSDIKFGFPVKSVQEILLDGDVKCVPESYRAGKETVMKVQIPQFGIRTYLLTLK